MGGKSGVAGRGLAAGVPAAGVPAAKAAEAQPMEPREMLAATVSAKAPTMMVKQPAFSAAFRAACFRGGDLPGLRYARKPWRGNQGRRR